LNHTNPNVPSESWSRKLVRLINNATTSISGKALSPDWFVLREHIELAEHFDPASFSPSEGASILDTLTQLRAQVVELAIECNELNDASPCNTRTWVNMRTERDAALARAEKLERIAAGGCTTIGELNSELHRLREERDAAIDRSTELERAQEALRHGLINPKLYYDAALAKAQEDSANWKREYDGAITSNGRLAAEVNANRAKTTDMLNRILVGIGRPKTCDSLECIADDLIIAQYRDDVAALKAQLSESRKNEAVCHCGALLSEHTQSDNHGAVPMDHPCPNLAEVKKAQALYESSSGENAKLTSRLNGLKLRLRDALNAADYNRGCYNKSESMVTALLDQINGLRGKAVWCFSEEQLPQYIQGVAGENEICSEVTADECNNMVKIIADYEARKVTK